MTLWRRLTRTTPHEVRVRAGDTLRTAREALAVATGRHGWRREDLVGRLDTSDDALASVVAALRTSDWAAADRELRAHFRRRPQRFIIDPALGDETALNISAEYPTAAEDARRRADRIVAGRFDVLGYKALAFGDAGVPDWHFDPVHGRRAPRQFWKRLRYLDPAYGDHKIIWELNRHQYFLALGRAAWLTGDPRYAETFARHVNDWMRENPPWVGINWASMLELGFRSISWLWGLHFFAADAAGGEPRQPWTVDLLLGIDRQLEHVTSHLSLYFSPNTHLLGEALALYVVGTALPELRGSARWREVGRRVLLNETVAQVHPDGGHAELSAHYHRYALDFYLLALAVARVNHDGETAATLTGVCDRMAAFCRALADEHGRLPMLGDDDGGMLFPMCGRDPVDASDSLALAASLVGRPELAPGDPPEEVLWMLGGDRSALVRPQVLRMPESTRFEDTGYVVLSAPGEHLVLDAGPHGFLNSGHAHADALSVVLSVDGVPLLIDPGTATYTMDPRARDRFRSTAMHNTLLVDGRNQSEPDGPFHWRTRANGEVLVWRPASAFDFVEVTHDGYGSLVHRRAVLAMHDRRWLIVDHLLGEGTHRIDTFWHLHPVWRHGDADAAQFRAADDRWAGIVSSAGTATERRGDAEGVGWCAPAYGRMEPASVLNFTSEVRLPATVVTAIAAGPSPRPLHIELLPVGVDAEDEWHRAAVTVSDGTVRYIAMFATPRTAAFTDTPRALWRAVTGTGALATDARMAALRLSESGEPLTLSLVDGRAAQWTGDPPVTLRVPAPAAALHFDIAAERRLSRAGKSRRLG